MTQIKPNTEIEVVNRRADEFTVVFDNNETYVWQGAQGDYHFPQTLTYAQIMRINSRGVAFKKGYLYIENEEVRKRLGLEREETQKFHATKEELAKMLKGAPAMFNKLEEYKGDRDMMSNIIEIAKEIGVTNGKKIDSLSKWSGINREKLTDDLIAE